jgi:hypothetical protein
LHKFFADRGSIPTLGVTKINVVFDNTLQALTTQGASAFIRQEYQLIITTNIPSRRRSAGDDLPGVGAWLPAGR